MGIINLSDQQQRRAQVLDRVSTGKITLADAARLLALSERQVRRLQQAYRKKGMSAVVHGNAGRMPANKTDAAIVEKVRELAGPTGPYHSYNTCHLAEVLARDHDIVLARATLDRLLIKTGLRKRSKPGEQVRRKRRKRRSAEGAMIQLDGSSYAWLGDVHPPFCLLGGIDDATGKIVGLVFRPTEDQAGYLLLLRQISVSYGLPMSVYHDKHTILRSPKPATIEDELAGTLPKSQIGHILERLGVEQIIAHSPQAKGRIERLWGTLQDRLAKELVTAKITTIEAANGFLPEFLARFNTTFAREPAHKESVWTPLEKDMDLDYYFSTCQSRTVKPDHTLSYEAKTLQLLPEKKSASLTGQRVEVHGLPDGTLFVYHGRQKVAHKPLSAPAPRICAPRQPNPKPAVPVDPETKRASRRKQMAHLFGSLGG